MDLAWIAPIIAVVIGSGGILYWKLTRNKLKADTRQTHAEAEGTETGTLISIIGVLRGELDRLAKRLGDLEERVTVLERENRGLKQMVAQFRELVRRLWAVIRDNDLEADGDLAEAVFEALEDSAV